jgi:hypothetical protein
MEALCFNGNPKDLKTGKGRHILIDETAYYEAINRPVEYKVNPFVIPWQIDFASGRRGICELKGDDLRICHGNERPKDFASGTLTVLKRSKTMLEVPKLPPRR